MRHWVFALCVGTERRPLAVEIPVLQGGEGVKSRWSRRAGALALAIAHHGFCAILHYTDAAIKAGCLASRRLALFGS